MSEHCEQLCEVCPLRTISPEAQEHATQLFRKLFSYYHRSQVESRMVIQYRNNPNAGLKGMLTSINEGEDFEGKTEAARALAMTLTDNCINEQHSVDAS